MNFFLNLQFVNIILILIFTSYISLKNKGPTGGVNDRTK